MKSGAVYFAIVFALGFVLGTARTLVLAPRIGETSAVLVELPIMLAASWMACRWVIERFALSERFFDRAIMGAVALVLLITAETVLGVFAFDRSLADYFASYRSPPGQLGLAGQILFGAFPVLMRRRGQHRP
jgi:hypothetical protein